MMNLRTLFSLTILSQILFSNATIIAPETLDTSNYTVLQKHVAFFDRDHDGVIYPKETFQGFRAIGIGIPLATTGSAFIHAFLSKKTSSGKISAIYLAIEIENIQKAKHGSDSGVYDTEGRFVPSKFEEIFSKHAHKNPNAFTFDELKQFLNDNKQPGDSQGSLGAFSEWKILFDIGKDKDDLLQKETIRAVYDGSLFYQLEKEHSKKTLNKN